MYVDDRILTEDTTVVTFDSFPSDLHVLELTWVAYIAGDFEEDDVIYMAFNGNYPSASNDTFWNLTMTNQQGSQGSATDASTGFNDSAGAIGYVSLSKLCWGRIRFPAYNSDFNGAISPEGPPYVGDGGWADTGGGAAPDAWTVSGYLQGGGALTEIQLFAQTIDPIPAARDFASGSRFTLTGY